jgi:hypothetical protein
MLGICPTRASCGIQVGILCKYFSAATKSTEQKKKKKKRTKQQTNKRRDFGIFFFFFFALENYTLIPRAVAAIRT